jgi:signal transduction histidine kinase
MACGLVRIARPDLDAWTADPSHTIKTTVFDSSDGVRSSTMAGGYTPHAAKSPDGRLWFATLDGVSVVDPHHLPLNKLPPPVHVETVKVNGKEVAAADGIALSHSSNDIEIDYTALSLTIPERVRFRYKLEGHDADWQDVGTRRQAYYGGLPPKAYRFRVMACNNDGVWNEAGAAWNFSIVPAYYQTIWFQGLCVLAGAGLLWLLYRLRLRQVTARVNLLYNERLAERTRIARDLHDTLLQSLAGVSLQLDGISKQAARVPERVPSLIARVREQVDSAFREARTKVWNLRSTSLEAQGLEGALRQLVERIGPAMTARCSVTVTGQPRPCSPEIEEELLRIAQEAANNANRHAQASEIRIALNYGAGSLTLSISDDGRGFEFEEGLRKSGHWGLKNMQERAAQIRGTCKITTAAGRGTQIEIRVPLSSWSLRNALTRNTLAKHAHSGSGSR